MGTANIFLTVVGAIGFVFLLAYTIIFGLGDFLDLCYRKGIPLPDRIIRSIKERRITEFASLLQEIGVIDKKEVFGQVSQVLDIPLYTGELDIKSEFKRMARPYVTEKVVTVGKTRGMRFPYFLDLMGASTNNRICIAFARILAAFIREEMSRIDRKAPIVFDKLVVPKGGSPILGYELGPLLRKPCVLFRGDDDPTVTEPYDPAYYFDGKVRTGDKVVLVDDSTTGGRMFMDAITKLKEIGATVDHAFVLFEPLGKKAHELLQENGVILHSLVIMDGELLRELGASLSEGQPLQNGQSSLKAKENE